MSFRPHFLTSPGVYVRTQRARQSPADANPFRKFDSGRSRWRAVLDGACMAAGAALLLWLFWIALGAARQGLMT